MEEAKPRENVRISPQRGYSPPLPPVRAKSQHAVELCWLWTSPVSSLWEESAADSETIEESHIFCHWDPRGDLAGRASLLCSNVQAEPSLWRRLLAALLYMEGHLLTGDGMTLEPLLQRCSFWLTCLTPLIPFHSLHLCSSSSDVPKWTAGWMVSRTPSRDTKGAP